jgi:putative Mn2+ efflux pump MntP
LVARVKKKHLVLICALLSLWQMAALFLGSFLARLLCSYDMKAESMRTVRILAAAIFICLGIRQIFKAWKNESIDERREDDLGVKRFLYMAAVASNYTLLTGVALGFLNSTLWLVLLMIAAFTIVVVVLGMYTGYRLGFEQKSKAYLAGGALLIIGGIDVVVRYICM